MQNGHNISKGKRKNEVIFMPATAIFSMDRNKIHTATSFGMRFNHNYRTKGCDNANPEEAKYNEELIPLKKGCKTFNDAFRKRKRELPYYDDHDFRKNGVRGVEFLLYYGSGDYKKTRQFPENFDFDKWKQENVEWIKETFGEENVVSAVLHMDETVPHIHVIVLPVDERGRFNAKDVFGPKALERYQESYAERMHTACGLKKRVKHSRAKHEDIDKFYAAVNEAVLYKLPEPHRDKQGEIDEDMEDYYNRAQQAFTTRNLQNVAKVKELEHEIERAKRDFSIDAAERTHLLLELEELKNAMGGNIEEMKKKLKWIETLNEGLKNFPDQEKAKEIRDNINEVISYELARNRKVDRDL